jgi:transcriptional regulator with XRE-family HTH domain
MNTAPEMSPRPSVGEGVIDRICRLLAERGHSQVWLCRKIGVREKRISRWKAGHGEPSGSQLYRIARALGVPMESLVDDDSGGEPPEGR